MKSQNLFITQHYLSVKNKRGKKGMYVLLEAASERQKVEALIPL